MLDGFVELLLGSSVETIGKLQLMVVVIALQVSLLRNEANGRDFLLRVFKQIAEGHKVSIGRSPHIERSLDLLDEVVLIASSGAVLLDCLLLELIDKLEVSVVGNF